MAEKPNLNSLLNKAADRKTTPRGTPCGALPGTCSDRRGGNLHCFSPGTWRLARGRRGADAHVIVGGHRLAGGHGDPDGARPGVDWPAASAPEGNLLPTPLAAGQGGERTYRQGEPILVAKLAGSGRLCRTAPPGMRAAACGR